MGGREGALSRGAPPPARCDASAPRSRSCCRRSPPTHCNNPPHPTPAQAFRGGAAAEADLLEDGAVAGASIDMPDHMGDLNLSLDVLGTGVGGLE